jgi:hypothetical protein
MYIPYITYLWTFGSFPLFCYEELCCYEHFLWVLSEYMLSFLLDRYLGVDLVVSFNIKYYQWTLLWKRKKLPFLHFFSILFSCSHYLLFLFCQFPTFPFHYYYFFCFSFILLILLESFPLFNHKSSAFKNCLVFLGMGGGRIKKNDVGGELNYDTL